MKPSILLTIISLFTLLFFTQCQQNPPATATTNESASDTLAYDSLLAHRLGADDYGMKQYVMAFLKAGPTRDQDSLTAAKL